MKNDLTKKTLKAEERLIVAFDFEPPKPYGSAWVRQEFLALLDKIKGTGVYVKANSALRCFGYGFIHQIQYRGLKFFADLKLNDVPRTLKIDGMLLREAKPDIVTVMCNTGVKSMQALKAELPDTEVLGVTFLTSLDDNDAQNMFSCLTAEQAVLKFAKIAHDAIVIDGLISSPKEVAILREIYGGKFTLDTPNIRPKWAQIQGDSQNPDRAMTPFEAIKAGADRIVVGGPIINAKDPYDAVMRTIEEIALAMK